MSEQRDAGLGGLHCFSPIPDAGELLEMDEDAGILGRYGSVDRSRRSSANQSSGAEMTADVWIWQPKRVTEEFNREKRRAELQEVFEVPRNNVEAPPQKLRRIGPSGVSPSEPRPFLHAEFTDPESSESRDQLPMDLAHFVY
ncbi:hypothetical protein CPLU01_12157 [Colletotrichum plurivorum]|uniref:Uncharacterized protein n=1 Tax=Colletotrichum plurivorum TaxID=2175906 RepID=A0A8H6JZW4_9PEZI|nr:hypothetical protein CPLU01_12157 [Colletotrichum plurivorum]